MSRFEQWDIVTGIGLTALSVAAGRALETQRPDSLMSDPYADAFVAAAGPGVPVPRRPEDLREMEARFGADSLWTSLSGYVGLRSRFFDDYFAEAISAGVTQVVLLAAGLDTRAFRLDWPDGSDLFESDQSKVLEFKGAVLADRGAGPRCDRRAVAVDLREDWPAALLAAGFRPERPTAWLAEGLLPYLPAGVERQLFDRIGELSAPGSRLAVEHLEEQAKPAPDSGMVQQGKATLGLDIAGMWHTEGKEDPVRRLTRDGWTVGVTLASQAADAHQRKLVGAMGDAADHLAFLAAHR